MTRSIRRRRVRRLAALVAAAGAIAAATPARAIPPTLLCPSRVASMTNPVTGEHLCVT